MRQPLLALDEPVIHQMGQRMTDRDAADAQLLHQFPFRWEAPAHWEPSAANPVDQEPPHLRVLRFDSNRSVPTARTQWTPAHLLKWITEILSVVNTCYHSGQV